MTHAGRQQREAQQGAHALKRGSSLKSRYRMDFRDFCDSFRAILWMYGPGADEPTGGESVIGTGTTGSFKLMQQAMFVGLFPGRDNA